ncbi:EAL domain-containing protein [Oceanobacter mangrovi]|uniref:EAL domain-containing protein n=1 Tax=Oceanobacter mangrovi TaxID=2862510 RepID=UPI001C8DB3EF|nr:EAL domain-containing protein [Oceanobacter mangrovi]
MCLLLSLGARANVPVVLQLKWEHQFQFAGYYAALWQGYYAQEGLDVEIRPVTRPDGSLYSPIREITSGNADFAIGGTDLFVYRGKGYDIKVVAPVFQRSPAALFALKEHAPLTVPSASRLRIASQSSHDVWVETRAMFFINGIDPNRLHYTSSNVAPDALVNGSADVIPTYDISAPFRANELGIEMAVLYPRDHGVQFYGDMLYTSGQLARQQPELVEKFWRATEKGWRYALENRSLLAQRIATELPRYKYSYDDLVGYNRAFAERIDDYLFYPAVDIGHVNPERWQRTYTIVDRLHDIETPYDPMDLLFRPVRQTDKLLHWGVSLALVFALLVVMVMLVRKFGYAPSRWVGPLLVMLILALAEQGLEVWHRDDTRRVQALRVVESLATIRSRLEQVIARNLAELTGVAAFIGANPDVTGEQFDEYAKAVLEHDPQLINLAAAPDLKVRYVYPREGNEKVIGLDYNNVPDQLATIERAIKQNEHLLAGPVDLVQGGSAFISRAPVRVLQPDGGSQLWGIVSAPIDAAQVYREAGLLDPDLELEVAIRGRDGTGQAGEVFYGRPELFAADNATTQSIRFSGGSWQIAALPAGEVQTNGARLVLIRGAFGSVGLLLIILLFYRQAYRQRQRQYEKILRRHTEFLREVETVAGVGGWRMNDKAIISELSEHACTLLQLPAGSRDISLREFSECFSPSGRQAIFGSLAGHLQLRQPLELELRSADYRRWFRLIADPVRSQEESWELLGALQDITEKKAADAKIERQANYDSLTELPNRVLFYDRLESAMAHCRKTGQYMALLFIDLDQFKAINDNYGHREGDRVLQESAQRILRCLGETDTVARHSGDEFTVILSELDQITGLDNIAANLVTDLARAHRINNKDVFCGASIGIALYPGDADNAEDLIIKADQAMYEVKKSGRNGWHFYTQEMQLRSEYRHRLYNDLIAAIRDDEIIAYLQPLVDSKTGKTVGCEALARWQRSDGVWLSPAEFIPLAEETGLINQIDYLVMSKASEALIGINQRCNTHIGLSVNVSPRVFDTRDHALERWMELLYRVSENLPITVEITERLLIDDDTRRAAAVLQDMADHGIGISIDDFGTGYSSLSYVTRFPVSGLKIDRSFVDGIGTGGSSEPLIETILAMANRLGLKVVAEGVETAEQLHYLQQQNCHQVQGYFLGKPMPLEAFEQRIQQQQGVESQAAR